MNRRKVKQSTSSTNRTTAPRILTAALIGLAAAVAGHAQTVAGIELPGLVPPAVTNGTAVTAGSFSPSQMLRLVFGLQHPHMADEEQFLVDAEYEGISGVQAFPDRGRLERALFALPAGRAGRGRLGAGAGVHGHSPLP